MKRFLLMLVACQSLVSVSHGQEVSLVAGTGLMHFVGSDDYLRTQRFAGRWPDFVFPFVVGIRYTPTYDRVLFQGSLHYFKGNTRYFNPALDRSVSLLPGEVRSRRTYWAGSVGAQWMLFKSGRGPFLALDILFGEAGYRTILGTYAGDQSYSEPGSLALGPSVAAGLSFAMFSHTSLEVAIRYSHYGFFVAPSHEDRIQSVQVSAILAVPIWQATTND